VVRQEMKEKLLQQGMGHTDLDAFRFSARKALIYTIDIFILLSSCVIAHILLLMTVKLTGM